MFQANSSASQQVLGQWQNSGEKENHSQQIQPNEEQQHLHSLEKHSSRIDHFPEDAKDQSQLISDQSEKSSSQFIKKEQPNFPEQKTVVPKQEFTHPSENPQQLMQRLNNQQAPAVNQANNAVRNKVMPSISFHLLIPVLRPQLDKDRQMQLMAAFMRLRVRILTRILFFMFNSLLFTADIYFGFIFSQFILFLVVWFVLIYCLGFNKWFLLV